MLEVSGGPHCTKTVLWWILHSTFAKSCESFYHINIVGVKQITDNEHNWDNMYYYYLTFKLNGDWLKQCHVQNNNNAYSDSLGGPGQ